MPNEIQNFIKTIPIVTRSYLGAAILLSLATSFSFVSPYKIANIWPLTLQLQIWRPFTSFAFFGKLGLNFLFSVVFFYRYSKSLEESTFRSDTKSFLFLYAFIFTMIMLVSTIINIPFSSEILREAITYLYSRYNPEVRVAFLGLFSCPARYLPLVTILIAALSGESIFSAVLGTVIGHIYFYFMSVVNNSWLQKSEDLFVKFLSKPARPQVRAYNGTPRHLE